MARWTVSEFAFKWHRTRGRTLWAAGEKDAARREWGISGWIRKELNKLEPPPPPPEDMWRATAALNYVEHREYKSMAVHGWYATKGEAEAAKKELTKELYDKMERELHWDWRHWVPDEVNWAVDKVPYERDLIGQITGEPGGLGITEAEYKYTMARFMIRTERWFKGPTLKKWFGATPGLKEELKELMSPAAYARMLGRIGELVEEG